MRISETALTLKPSGKPNETKNKMHTITDLKDFDPKTTEIIDGDAYFDKFLSITDLGVLLEIRGSANFRGSQIKSLGNLQTIGGSVIFGYSQVQDLGDLKTIGGRAYFRNSEIRDLGNLRRVGDIIYWGNRTDLKKQWEKIVAKKVSSKIYAYLKDFDPIITKIIKGNAFFHRFPHILDLGNLLQINGFADFRNSKIPSLGKLEIIRGDAYIGSEVKDLGNLNVIFGNAYFRESQIRDLGNLIRIGGNAYFKGSQIRDLGNLMEIGGNAYFKDSQIRDLGNLKTIGRRAEFGNRTDLKAEWEVLRKNK
jgi:hypothetical protein